MVVAAFSALIITDDAGVRQQLEHLLTEARCSYACAGTEAEALELIETSKQGACVILLDALMPDVRGWQFMQLCRESDILLTIPVTVSAKGAGGYEKSLLLDHPIIDQIRKYCEECGFRERRAS